MLAQKQGKEGKLCNKLYQRVLFCEICPRGRQASPIHNERVLPSVYRRDGDVIVINKTFVEIHIDVYYIVCNAFVPRAFETLSFIFGSSS